MKEYKVFGWVFAVLGAGAVVCAVCGARHQLLTAALCGVMAWVSFAEAKREKMNKMNQ